SCGRLAGGDLGDGALKLGAPRDQRAPDASHRDALLGDPIVDLILGGAEFFGDGGGSDEEIVGERRGFGFHVTSGGMTSAIWHSGAYSAAVMWCRPQPFACAERVPTPRRDATRHPTKRHNSRPLDIVRNN